MIKYPPYSVLMSVYNKERPEYLKKSLESMLLQTIRPEEIVLVCDGPLTPQLDCIIEEMIQDNPLLFTIIRLEQNSGLGNALKVGLPICRNNWVCRMDSDDVSVLTRCETQLNFIMNNPSISIVGGYIKEFEHSIHETGQLRIAPLKYDYILKQSKIRNPFNHTTVFINKSDAIQAGGYRDFLFFEDYDLWIRMIERSCRVENIPEILVNVRAGESMIRRRRGIIYIKQQFNFRRNLWERSYISLPRFVITSFLHGILLIIPVSIHRYVIKHFLRD